MSIEISPQSDVMARLQEAAINAAKGVRDCETAKRAARSMDRISEEIKATQGVLNFAVPFVRDSRDA